jgi:UDP-N-acetyl-D-glucosamine dehydrogenase
VHRGADVRYCDPHIPVLDIDGEAYTSVAWTDEEVTAADCVVLLTAHQEFLETARWDRAALIVDTRNAVPAAAHVRKL